MKRFGDIILGTAMCLIALATQGFVLLLLIGFPAMAMLDNIGLQWLAVVTAGVGYNWLAFQHFKRDDYTFHRTLSTRFASLFPRGLWRIIHGRETYSAAEFETRGFDVVLHAEKV